MENYGEKAVFVHVYGPEPHPAAPDLNFDAGTLLSNYWSVWRQSVTYEDRVEKAKTIRSITHPDQVKNGLLCMHTMDRFFSCPPSNARTFCRRWYTNDLACCRVFAGRTKQTSRGPRRLSWLSWHDCFYVSQFHAMLLCVRTVLEQHPPRNPSRSLSLTPTTLQRRPPNAFPRRRKFGVLFPTAYHGARR